VATPDPEPHEWFSVLDEEGTTWMFDITFLTSSWACIWGRGCPGIDDEPHPEREHGCCTYGAHFADKADRRRVKGYAEQLGPDEWQYRDLADQLGGPIWKNEDGEWVTRLVDNACIFNNRPGFVGGAGCALHGAALRRGERYIDWKPEVCWQLPLRLEHHYDDNENLVYTLREWKRRDWGEGGADLGWWCVDSTEAFVAQHPVVETLRDEIVELVGSWAYAQLVDYLRNRRRETPLPHPVLKTSH
jgi:hypothetical protein